MSAPAPVLTLSSGAVESLRKIVGRRDKTPLATFEDIENSSDPEGLVKACHDLDIDTDYYDIVRGSPASKAANAVMKALPFTPEAYFGRLKLKDIISEWDRCIKEYDIAKFDCNGDESKIDEEIRREYLLAKQVFKFILPYVGIFLAVIGRYYNEKNWSDFEELFEYAINTYEDDAEYEYRYKERQFIFLMKTLRGALDEVNDKRDAIIKARKKDEKLRSLPETHSVTFETRKEQETQQKEVVEMIKAEEKARQELLEIDSSVTTQNAWIYRNRILKAGLHASDKESKRIIAKIMKLAEEGDNQ